MAEYNWWDDRTVEENDDMMCPIINYPCPHENCGECEDYKAFIQYYRAKEILSIIREIKEEK